jgi:hypothetical protein
MDLIYIRLPPLSAKEGMFENAMLTSSWVKLEFFQPSNYTYSGGFVNCSMAFFSVLRTWKIT